MKRSFKDYFIISLKGMAMGAADVVPGVSGGTIAFISGIYEELLSTIGNLNLSVLKDIKNEGLANTWKKVNANFLLALLVGIAISVVSLAKIISSLLANHPIIVWSFFFGLVLASILYIVKQIPKWNVLMGFVLVLMTVIGYAITVMKPMVTDDAPWWFLILAGAFAICAMILPGISGAFILVLLGAYAPILAAIHERNLKIIALVGFGAITGLLSFAKVLKWLFEHYKSLTLAALVGLMIGSLNKIWPWKETLSTRINSKGLEVPVLQKSFNPLGMIENTEIFTAFGFAIIGFGFILLLEKVATYKAK